LIHAYCTIGLGLKLVKETLPLAGKHYAETTVVLAAIVIFQAFRYDRFRGNVLRLGHLVSNRKIYSIV